MPAEGLPDDATFATRMFLRDSETDIGLAQQTVVLPFCLTIGRPSW